MYTKSNDPSVCSFLRSFFSGRSLLIVCLFIRSAGRNGVCHESLALKNIISPQVKLYNKMYWKYIDIEKKKTPTKTAYLPCTYSSCCSHLLSSAITALLHNMTPEGIHQITEELHLQLKLN